LWFLLSIAHWATTHAVGGGWIAGSSPKRHTNGRHRLAVHIRLLSSPHQHRSEAVMGVLSPTELNVKDYVASTKGRLTPQSVYAN
jgi:hypothetical protein